MSTSSDRSSGPCPRARSSSSSPTTSAIEVLVKDYQEDIVSGRITHIDFYEIDQSRAAARPRGRARARRAPWECARAAFSRPWSTTSRSSVSPRTCPRTSSVDMHPLDDRPVDPRARACPRCRASASSLRRPGRLHDPRQEGRSGGCARRGGCRGRRRCRCRGRGSAEGEERGEAPRRRRSSAWSSSVWAIPDLATKAPGTTSGSRSSTVWPPGSACAGGGRSSGGSRWPGAAVGGELWHLFKPLTFMNASGEVLASMLRAAKAAPADVLVVCDSLDLPAGVCRLRTRGSSGGQKGLESIIRHAGTDEIMRLVVGIGRPSSRKDVVSYVLGRPGPDEAAAIAGRRRTGRRRPVRACRARASNGS